jgi:hypothetical protein
MRCPTTATPDINKTTVVPDAVKAAQLGTNNSTV